MITFLLVILILFLLCVIYFQFQANKSRTVALTHIHRSLSRIISDDTSEKIFWVTGDQELKSVLNEINNLLDHNQHMHASYNKMEISMKKMISNISHDLKTPLTVILGYIETINHDSGMSHVERTRMLSKIHQKTIEVIDLIGTFFDLAKLEAGDKEFPLTRIQMNEVCKKNILEFYDILTAKGFDVLIEIPDQPVHAWGNLEALSRILNNLISNAIQHGGDSKTLGLTLKCDDQHVYVEIWDKGKGIDEWQMDRVFERMYTLEDSRNKSYQGSGLGLTITKRLAENIEGAILLTSKPYEKTVFTLRLKRIRY